MRRKLLPGPPDGGVYLFPLPPPLELPPPLPPLELLFGVNVQLPTKTTFFPGIMKLPSDKVTSEEPQPSKFQLPCCPAAFLSIVDASLQPSLLYCPPP